MNHSLDFEKQNGLLPVIVQHAHNQVVLMLGFMNEAAYTKTMAEKKVTFFSRTKNRLWTKGETSGNFLHVIDIKIDCDADTLLIHALPEGNVCHTGQETCFGNTESKNSFSFLHQLQHIIAQRQQASSEVSYISSLFQKGINKIAQKVGEEAVEVVIEAKDNDDEKFLNEAADLLFHYLILLKAKGTSLENVIDILENRHKKASKT